MQPRPTILPGTHPTPSPIGRGPRCGLLRHPEAGCPPGGGHAGAEKSRYLAYKGRIKGELSPDPVLEAPTGRENYSSAETHADDIRATFVEEMAMDMVLGPFTAAEAASRCNCLVSELCPGPMAAIDEGDKIRTIYDGSWGRANAQTVRSALQPPR